LDWSFLTKSENYKILEDVECLPVTKTNDGFLPGGGASGVCTTTALGFSCVVAGANVEDLHFEELFNSALDLDLVGSTSNLEGILVVLLLKKGGLLRHANGVDDLVNISHGEVGLSGAGSEGFERVLNDHDDVGVEDLLDVNGSGGLKENALHVASGEVGLIGERTSDDENLLGISDASDGCNEIFGLTAGDFKGRSADNSTFIDLVTEHALESECADLFINSFAVAAVTRTEGDTTTDEDRGFAVTVTGVTGAFLAIHLLTGSADFTTGLGLGSSGAAVSVVSNHEVVHCLISLGGISDDRNFRVFRVLNCES